MSRKTQLRFKGSSMANSNKRGIATLAVIGIVTVVCIGLGWVSAHYLGPDNAAETLLEDLAEHEIEDGLHAPEGSMKDEVDAFFPHAKKT
jgi:hypothetical protein